MNIMQGKSEREYSSDTGVFLKVIVGEERTKEAKAFELTYLSDTFALRVFKVRGAKVSCSYTNSNCADLRISAVLALFTDANVDV